MSNLEITTFSISKLLTQIKHINEKPKIYLFMCTSTGYYKIGFTTRPIKSRLSNVNSQSPTNIICYSFVEHSFITKEVEKIIHKRFKSYHVKGEWFDFNSTGINIKASDIIVLIQLDVTNYVNEICKQQ